ncbi:GNAT family N-acetyltransferase [Litoribacterium kuwaitense]|uniref:GNAT family N-acetyltransferase n=1 Tax=Litoribacterium kuwaitense TaxID=1398745 RepID=UPI0013ED3573|nr:GNAT family N-acetyltransferase [Litoribacterium kuwaitense]
MKLSKTRDFELIVHLNKSVQKLHRALYPDYFNDYDFIKIKEAFRKQMENEKVVFLLIEDEEEACGYGWIEFRDVATNAFRKGYRSVFVHQIGILPSERNKGYAERLLCVISELARDQGITRIALDDWTDNDMAKTFY